jgi:hypothetical protein
MALEVVEIRCPVGPKKLFAKFRLEGGTSPHVTEDNLIEFACYECKKTEQRRDSSVSQVFHRFNFFGELVETAIAHDEV